MFRELAPREVPVDESEKIPKAFQVRIDPNFERKPFPTKSRVAAYCTTQCSNDLVRFVRFL